MSQIETIEQIVIELDGRKSRSMLEYRIIAINKAGDGEPSNTAMVVL